jgi:hypothetical protein
MAESRTSVETDVDVLVSLVKEKGRISIDDAAKLLKISPAILQRWVDFLVEEEILGIEYKFVTPYLYFNKDAKNSASVLSESEGEYLEDKNVFFQKARDRGLPIARINSLWQKYLISNLEEIRDHFIRKAKSRNITEHQIQELWQQYYAYLKRAENDEHR